MRIAALLIFVFIATAATAQEGGELARAKAENAAIRQAYESLRLKAGGMVAKLQSERDHLKRQLDYAKRGLSEGREATALREAFAKWWLWAGRIAEKKAAAAEPQQREAVHGSVMMAYAHCWKVVRDLKPVTDVESGAVWGKGLAALILRVAQGHEGFTHEAAMAVWEKAAAEARKEPTK